MEQVNLPAVASGTLVRLDSFPSKWVQARHVDIWLPATYNPKQQCRVLYMHDGQMLFDAATTWNKQEWGVDEVLGQLMAAEKIHPCIVVGVWNNSPARHAEYFPQKPFESLRQTYRDSLLHTARRNPSTALFSTEIQSDHYLKFLTEELKPYIDQHYATFPDRSHTFIAGSSMGGLISMYAICEYPDIFGGAACLSTHWPGTFEAENNPIPTAFCNYLANHLPDPATHKFYFDYGTATLDSLYEPFQLQVDSVMLRKGYEASHWVTRKFEGEDHSERAWRKRLDVPILFLLGKE
ncbi:MAG TPA: alpha/beta hydrolase-fold protein [Saprospiraceae bacterium]|nr:alpha/beta hydrolase-fold protein [Saprospiraceae bacterium]HMQ85249.1 alpha/beta hydrolase-fold protein [Saprospiraceae bacterium]